MSNMNVSNKKAARLLFSTQRITIKCIHSAKPEAPELKHAKAF
jgi:hypothetical protein